jgi:hypothetical protein
MKNLRSVLGAAALGGALASVLALGGCWNDDNGAGPPAPEAGTVPDSAGTSAAAFVAYLPTLSSSDETSEPLLLNSSFAVPDDDTSDPAPLT